MSSETKEHLDNFHDREETDSNPQAGLPADIRDHVHASHRRLLGQILYHQRLAHYIDTDEVILNFSRPVGGPVRWQCDISTFDEGLGEIGVWKRRCCHSRRSNGEINR